MNAKSRRFNSVLFSLLHRKSFMIVAAVTFLLALACIVRIFVPNRVYTFEGEGSYFADQGGEGSLKIFENISLSPGVYHIKLDYDIDTDYTSFCTVEDNYVYPGALLVNHDILYANRTSTDFVMWLFESTDTLAVTVSKDVSDTLRTGNLTIVETNGLWTMLFTLVLFFGTCVMGCILFSVYQKEYGVSVRAKSVFFFLAVITLLSSTPFLLEGVQPGADLVYHYHRIEAVGAGLTGGQFPVRIAPRWLYGQGYADPIFYCNLLLVFPAILRLLGFPLNASYQIFAVCINALMAWIAYYSYSRILQNYKIGLCCSCLYTLSAVHSYKLAFIGALGEGTAHIFMPLVLLGLYETFSTSDRETPKPKAWIHLALGYAGLFQTHILSTEITIILTFAFCLAYLRSVFQKSVFFTLLKGALGAVAISLWFLVPFVDYYLTQNVRIKNVFARTIQNNRAADIGHFLQLFEKVPVEDLTVGDGMYNSEPYGGSLILAAGLVFFLLLWYSGRLREKSPLLKFLKVSAILSVILALFSLHIFPWDWLQALHPAAAPFISSLQFPTRLLSWLTCLLIVLIGYLFINRRLYFGNAGNYLLAGSMLLAVLSSGYLLENINSVDHFKVYSEEGLGFGYLSGAEYLIWGTNDALLTFDKPHPSDTVSVANYTNEMLHITARCTNTGQEQGYVDMPLLLYKGYRAYDTDTGEELEIIYNPNNQLRVLLPASFSGNIDISFVSPLYWRMAEIASLLVLICFWAKPFAARVEALYRTKACRRRRYEKDN